MFRTLEQMNASKVLFENVQLKLTKCLALKDQIDAAHSQSTSPKKLISKLK